MKLSLGVLALALAIGLNVRHALNDYGVKDNKLHVEVLAQATTTIGWGSTTSTSSTKTGPSDTASVTCTKSTTTTVTTNNGNTSNSGWNGSGTAGVGNGVVGGSVSGGYSSGSGSSTGTSTTVSETTTETYQATKILCENQGIPYANCTPFDPCTQ